VAVTQPQVTGASLRDRLEEICREHGIDALYAFGSRAAELAKCVREGAALDERSRSDIDLAVLPRPGHRLSARARVALTTALEDALGAAVPVDLAMLPEAGAALALEIIQGELLLTTDPVREAEYELFVLRRAGDLAPLERERRRVVLAGGRG
jgi:predicted nucleotidyltransferase